MALEGGVGRAGREVGGWQGLISSKKWEGEERSESGSLGPSDPSQMISGCRGRGGCWNISLYCLSFISLYCLSQGSKS